MKTIASLDTPKRKRVKRCCKWHFVQSWRYYRTSCRRKFVFKDGPYCPYCGRKIKELA